MTTSQELIQRWDTFLEKIATRFNESLQQAKEACHEQLIDTDYDYYTVFRSWQAMKAQISSSIVDKIDETWEQKVEPQMAVAGVDNYRRQGYKASDLSDGLNEKLWRFQTILEGELSQKFYDHVIETANQKFHCSQCEASLEIRKDLFRAQYITCQYCNTVNTFEPETNFIHVGGNIIDNIVALQCLPLLDAKENAFETIQKAISERKNTDDLWVSYKEKYFTYYETYFKERIKLKSDAQERYAEDMARKEKEYQEFENIQRYNKYGIN